MQVSVVRLRRIGMRLRPTELDTPLEGDLQIGDAGATSFRRPALCAQLWVPTHSVSFLRPIGRPLFEPQLVNMAGPTFSLAGLELEVLDGRRVVKHAQIWRCAVLPGEPQTPR